MQWSIYNQATWKFILTQQQMSFHFLYSCFSLQVLREQLYALLPCWELERKCQLRESGLEQAVNITSYIIGGNFWARPCGMYDGCTSEGFSGLCTHGLTEHDESCNWRPALSKEFFTLDEFSPGVGNRNPGLKKLRTY